MKMIVTTAIQKWWNDYNQTAAICQLNNNGVIFLDDYDCPIDNQPKIEELFNIFSYGEDRLPYNSRFYLSVNNPRLKS